MIKILVVDDEKPICDLIDLNLSASGYQCRTVQDGLEALNIIESEPFDLILLDIMLPGADGYDIMEYIRPMGIPVIFITAKHEVRDRVKGLKLGADDYLVKPFAFEELLARIRAMLRREGGRPDNCYRIADLVVDCDARTAARGNVQITLSSKEFSILEYLICNQGIVLTREKIEQHIWNYDYEGGSNVVDVYIRYLRKKIDDGFTPKLIHTVRGAGYVLKEA